MATRSHASRAGSDLTCYARAIGYTAAKPVVVLDGKVLSHRSVCWFAFCERLRTACKGVTR